MDIAEGLGTASGRCNRTVEIEAEGGRMNTQKAPEHSTQRAFTLLALKATPSVSATSFHIAVLRHTVVVLAMASVTLRDAERAFDRRDR